MRCMSVTKSPMLSSAVWSGLITIVKPGSRGVEVEVGDDDGDLDEFVDREVEPGHLAVDPDQSVVARSHSASLVRCPSGTAPPAGPGRRRGAGRSDRLAGSDGLGLDASRFGAVVDAAQGAARGDDDDEARRRRSRRRTT